MKLKIVLHDFMRLQANKKHAYSKYTLTFVLWLLFVCTALALDNTNKIDQIEELLYFYPQQGEMELQVFSNGNEQLSINDKNKIYYLKGILEFKKSNTDTAITHLQKALIYFIQENNVRYIAKSKLILANIAEKIGNLNQAQLYYYQVIETCKIKRELGYAYLGIARCQRYLNGIKKGKNYELDKGIKLLKSMGKKEYDLYADLIYCALTPKSNSHKKKLKNIAEQYVNIGIKDGASNVYKTLSVIYLNENILDLSEHYANEALPLTQNTYPTLSLLPTIYHIKGILDFRRKNYIGAKYNYKYALMLSDSLNQNRIKPYVYKSMSKLDSVNGNYESAQFYLEKEKEYKEINLKERNDSQIRIKELSLSLKFLKNELERKNGEELLEQRKAQVTLLILMIIAITIISIAVIIVIQKKGKYAQEQHYRQLKLEREQLKMQSERDREKHERAIEAMQNLLVQLKQDFEIKKLDNKKIEELFSCIPDIKTPLDCFEEAYADTILAFKNKCPMLAKGEIRYAIMFCIGLPANIIAFIKQVNLGTVRKNKNRIQHKLGLEGGASLQKHFHQVLKIEVDKKGIEKILKEKEQLPINNI